MPRARTKTELLKFGKEEFKKLLDNVKSYKSEGFLKKTIYSNRTTKDILAHLRDWHLLFIKWYEEGMDGKIPEIPAAGYTFKDLPKFNEKLYQDSKNLNFDKVFSKLKASHNKFMKIVKKHSNKELFTKKKYKWTRSTSVGSYLVSTGPSHYVWANDLLGKKLKKLQK